MTIWRGKLKIKLCILVDHSYEAELFSILAIGQKYLNLYEPFGKAIPHHVSYFFWCSFSIKLSLFQRRANKIITMQYDRFYLQNCKAITFAKKKINHTKNKLPNGPSHLYIFWLNFDKGNHSFLHHFLLLCETDFLKNAAWKNE